MADFTVVIMRPELVPHAAPPALACISVIVEADSKEDAANAGAARVILAYRRLGEEVRPEELAPIAVYAGRHVNMIQIGNVG